MLASAEEERVRRRHQPHPHGVSNVRVLLAQLAASIFPLICRLVTKENSAKSIHFELFLINLNSKTMCHPWLYRENPQADLILHYLPKVIHILER